MSKAENRLFLTAAWPPRAAIKLLLVALWFLPMARIYAGPVRQQLDTLIAAAQGKRIGLITNPSGCDETGYQDANYLTNASGITISAFFAPEHGLRGKLPPGVGGGDYLDPETGIPVYAVYGIRNAPSDAQLATVDLLVFDLQDVGVRFYTFVWTMTHCMEAAARNGKPFYVIDRPNPIGGVRVEGAPNTRDYGLVGRLATGAAFGLATRHGMTVGEIAALWNQEWMSPKVQLHVLAAPGWIRDAWWTETGRVFVPPSPNMRTPEAATVYPGTCIFEASNLSEGRGTDRPFEKIGAPFINKTAWTNRLAMLHLPGVRFDAITFTPTNSKFANQLCSGVKVVVVNRDSFDPIKTGLSMLQSVYQLYPASVSITSYAATLMGTPNLETRIKSENIDAIIAGWQPSLAQFRALRSRYLLYPEIPSFASLRLLGPTSTQGELTWKTFPGRSYRLWYRDSFSLPWNIRRDYTSVTNTLTVTEEISSHQRFYRVELK